MASLFGTKTIALTEDVSMRVGGGVRYNGATTSRSGTFIVGAPSYTLVDVMAALDSRHWTLQLNAVNLFDEQSYPKSEARREGKECVSTCRYWRSPNTKQK